MRNLLVRAASGVVLFGVVLGAILWSKWSFAALLLAIIVGGQIEFYRMAQKAGYWPQRAMGVISGVLVFIVAFAMMWLFDKSSELDSRYLMITGGLVLYIILLLPLMFICELFRKSATPIANIATSLMGVVYVAMPLSLLLFIPLLLGGGEWKPWTLLFYIFIIWANDVFAYLFGITLGKHRLFERISPKKSWEGFFGGLLGSLGVAWLVASNSDKGLLFWGGLAILVTVTAVLGDLVESMFKRSVDVKDSGAIIPGHGGVLDRFDALLISAPFVCLFLMYFYQL